LRRFPACPATRRDDTVTWPKPILVIASPASDDAGEARVTCRRGPRNMPADLPRFGAFLK
jgi:hypothetical protein